LKERGNVKRKRKGGGEKGRPIDRGGRSVNTALQILQCVRERGLREKRVIVGGGGEKESRKGQLLVRDEDSSLFECSQICIIP